MIESYNRSSRFPAEKQPPSVLILNSYHQGYEWSDNEIEGALEGLRSAYSEITPAIEHLDLKRFPAEDHQARLSSYLSGKYRNHRIDLALILDNPAFGILLKHRDEILPGVPVVFAGVNDFTPEAIAGQGRITGIAEVQGHPRTLALALGLHPGTRRVLAVHDYTASGLAVRREMEAVLPAFRDRVLVEFNDAATYEEMARQIAALPPGSVVVNHPVSFYEQYKTVLWGASGIIAVLLALIGSLLVAIARRNRAEGSLRESEERYRLLYEKAPLPYQSLDGNGDCIEVNQTFLAALGYTRAEIIGRNFGELLALEWRDHFRENFPRFKAVGEILGIEFEMVKKDGSRILVSFNGKIAFHRNSRFQQTHCIFTDVTERRRTEAALVESTAWLKEAQKIARIGQWELDLITNTLDWSDSIYELFEIITGKFGASYNAFLDKVHPSDRDRVHLAYTRSLADKTPYEITHRLFRAGSPDDLVGKCYLELVHPDDRALSAERMKCNVDEHWVASPREHRILALDGQTVQVESTGVPVLYRGETQIFGVFRDITERRKADREREKLETQLRPSS
jgi:PAS domain S-box-containing protein